MATRSIEPNPEHAEATDQAYLALLGDRVREGRSRRGMTRKILSRDSGVSERYLAQLEGGQGNISILLLRNLARALDTPLETLVLDGVDPPVDLAHAMEVLRRLPPERLAEARHLLSDAFGSGPLGSRRNRVALIGLRGAGKTTLGRLLADRLGSTFVELDKEIEVEAGAPLAAIFDLYGQPAFRRLERRCLDRVIAQHPHCVIATGGGLVSDPGTFEHLLSSCYTVWIRASPAEHMQRVIAQGDMRPMADNREAMADLQRILKARDPLYSKADAQIDTSGRSIDAAAQALLEIVQNRHSA